MKKSFLIRKNMPLLMIIVWNIISTLFYWKPYLTKLLIFYNNEVKYEIVNNHINNQFIEENFYYNFVLFGVSIVCIFLEILFSIISFKKEKWIKFISTGICFQTIFSVLLGIWEKYLINSYDGIEIVNLKTWTVFSSIIGIFSVAIIVLKNKLAYIILCIANLLQIINTIMLFESNKGFFLSQSITNANYFNIVFQCANGIIIYILYWTLLLLKPHHQN